MPCKGTTMKGAACKRPCSGNWCLSHQQKGEGLLDDAKDFVKKRVADAWAKGPRTAASGRLQKFLDDNSDKKVVALQLGRKPIRGFFHGAMDFLSRGNFSKTAKKLGYDTVFHNYLLFTLDDGQVYKMEKNHILEYKKAVKGDLANEMWDIPVTRDDLSMKSMIENASAGNEKKFYQYKAGSDNCQRFSRDVIEKNGLMPANGEEPEHLSVQDAKSLTATVPFGDLIPDAITDLGSIIDRGIYGDGASAKSSFRSALFDRFI